MSDISNTLKLSLGILIWRLQSKMMSHLKKTLTPYHHFPWFRVDSFIILKTQNRKPNKCLAFYIFLTNSLEMKLYDHHKKEYIELP